jgi:dTDP-4-amino-4,6-dideoxygalactose transaminase
MKYPTWLRNWLKTDYTRRGFIARVAVDLVLSNLGMFLGMLTTVGIWAFTWTDTPRTFFHTMFLNVWLANAFMLTACCLIAFTLSGLYRGTRNAPYAERIFKVTKAVGTAFILFFSWIYLTGAFMPRSTMTAGWFLVFILTLGSRMASTVFSRKYQVISTDVDDPNSNRSVRKLSLASQQDGWFPPEHLSSKAPWPYFEEDEVLAASAVLKSGRINQWTGKEIEKFQEEFAAACGVRHAIALANGTVALELALRAYGIGPGDEVIVTPRTFIASASCIVLQGATPVFADVDQESQNITAETIRAVLSSRTKAIIAVHLAGWPCEMEAIMSLAAERDLIVIEDCAQAHGATYRDRPVGSFGHAAAFSFCQDKIMTTGGEGGMILTNDDDTWAVAWAFKDHGKSYGAVYRQEHPSGFRWLHESFGTNWRMTEMQAAIGRIQLRKLTDWIQKRKRNADILTKSFLNIPSLRVTIPLDHISHAYYKYYVFLKPEMLKSGWDRERIINAINAEGIPCFTGSCSEMYLEKAFDADGMRPEKRLPVAEELGDTAVMFLVHPTLSENDMRDMVKVVEKVMAEAMK